MAEEIPELAQSFLGGMNESIKPQLLQDSQYNFGLNITSRGGLVQTRPKWVDTDKTIASGRFQGMALYRLSDADRLVYVIAGVVYSWNLSTDVITTHTSTLSATADTCFFAQVERYFVIQDDYEPTAHADANWPVILNGDAEVDQSATRASDPEQAVPKGGPMAYGHGRLFVATPWVYNTGSGSFENDLGRTNIVAGDIIKAFRPTDVLNFTETQYPDAGGALKTPAEHGYIWGMEFQQNIQSGTGQGPLIVGSENGFSAFQVQTPRSTWQAIDLGYVLFTGVGTRSTHSFVTNNSDLLYRASDGFRTLAQTQAELQGMGLANDPISEEVRDLIASDDLAARIRVSAAKLDNRIFFTTKPNGRNFDALVSLDVSPIGSITSNATPVYDGAWTGLQFAGVATARQSDEERLFAMVQNDDADNFIYRLDSSVDTDEGNKAPLCRLYTRHFYFNQPQGVDATTLKEFAYIELWISGVRDTLTLNAYYRADNYPYWSNIDGGAVTIDGTGDKAKYGRVRLVKNSDIGVNPVNESLNDSGYSFQFCLEWQGEMQLDLVKFVARRKNADTTTLAVDLSSTSVKLEADSDQIALDNFTYEII